jgi:hypothetical protein
MTTKINMTVVKISTLACILCSSVAWSADALVVNADGTTKFNQTVSGPNVLGTQTPVAIAGGTTLDATAAGKIYTISGTAADYTITLPPAGIGAGVIVGFSVAPYASANKQYTITAVSGQTLDGRSNLVLIHTNYLEVISIGGQWVSRVKKVDTDWVDAGATVLTAVTTAPVKGAVTAQNDKVIWRRVGGNMEMSVKYYQTTAGSVGSGDYLWRLPNNYAMDVSKVTLSTSASPYTDGVPVGLGVYSGVYNAAYPSFVAVYPRDATSVRLLNSGQIVGYAVTVGVVSSGYAALNNSAIGWAWQACLPIQGW